MRRKLRNPISTQVNFFVGAASCRDVIVAGSHSHKKNPFIVERLRWFRQEEIF
jgi:hypothetical protein